MKNSRTITRIALHKTTPNVVFHYTVTRNGQITFIHDENKVLPIVQSMDGTTLHIAVERGIAPLSHRQEEALFDLLVELSEKYPKAVIKEIEFWEKGCPSALGLDVSHWLKNYEPDLERVA